MMGYFWFSFITIAIAFAISYGDTFLSLQIVIVVTSKTVSSFTSREEVSYA